MKQFKPLVSIVIPTFNRESLISATLQSVIDQSYTNWECFVIDDGSSDHTSDTVKEIIKSNPKISLYQRDRLPKGAPTCRNIGLEKATGTYIQFLDSDDILLPDKIASQIAIISTVGAKDIIHGSYQESRFNNNPLKTVVTVCNDNKWLNFFSGIGNTCANLFLTEAVKNIDGWDETLKSGQEPDLMFRMYQNGAKVIPDTNPNTLIRVQEKGITGSNPKENYIRFSVFVFRVYDYLLDKNLISEEEKEELIAMIYNTIRVLYRTDKGLGYNAYLKYNIRPSPHWNLSKYYLLCYSVLGFRLTERLFYFLKR